MVLPPTWSLAVADVVRYAALRPWQPRLTLNAAPEPLPKRIERLRAAWFGSRLADGTRCAKFNFAMLEAAVEQVGKQRLPTDPVLDALLELGLELALQNDNVFDFPSIDLSRSLTALEVAHITERLVEIETRITHDARIQNLFSEGLCSFYVDLLQELPIASLETHTAPFTVPLYALGDAAALVGRFLSAFLQDLVPATPDAIAALPFQTTRVQLWKNLLAVSRMTPEQIETAPHKIVGPRDSDLTPDEMIPAYLGGTPLAALLRRASPSPCPSRLDSSTATSLPASATARRS